MFFAKVALPHRSFSRIAKLVLSIILAVCTCKAAIVLAGIIGVTLALLIPGGFIVMALVLRIMAGGKAREETWNRVYAEHIRRQEG